MAAACDFDAIPRSITSAGSVRFFPRVSGFTKPITTYLWSFGDTHAFTIDGSTTDFLLSDADDYFAVGDRVVLTTTGTLPTGLSLTVCYWIKTVSATVFTLSLTSGGAAVTYTAATGSGTHSVQHGSDKPTPINVYPVVTAATLYAVILRVVDSDSNPATATHANFIRSDVATNVSAPPNDGTYPAISVLIYDDTNSMLVNRNPWTATASPFTGCHLYLLTPKTVDSIDKIGNATFSLLDVGDSDATEKSLMAEKKNVVFILGKTIIFSGKIRRITQNTQSGFDTSTRVKLWDVECDSDLAKLQQVNVDSTVLTADGEPLYDTPGNIARIILTPTSPARDTRGVINCVDAKTTYQLNSATQSESAGNQYDHIMALMAQNNYDLRSRADFLLYNYTAFDGSTIITNSGAGWTASEFVDMYVFFVGRDTPASKTFTTDYAAHTDQLLITTASTFFAVNDRVTLSTTGTLPTGLSATTYYVKSVTSTYITVSTTIGGAAVTVSSNGTGTHSIILVAETTGVKTYGKVTANDATTITCAAMIGADVAPQSLGYFLIYRGYLIDFAHDLSQPVAIENLDINQDVFQFSDNDDKRKLSTKIVATGKDLQGITISVAVAGVHAWNAEDQYFEDSTFISKKTEGYVYNNSYIRHVETVTVYPQILNGIWGASSLAPTEVQYNSGVPSPYIPVGAEVDFEAYTGTLPTALTPSTPYYVVESSSAYCKVSASPGGSPLDVYTGGTGQNYIHMRYGCFTTPTQYIYEGDPVKFNGTAAPTGIVFAWTYFAKYVSSLTGGGVAFAVMSGGGMYAPTTAGTSVYTYSPTDLQNATDGIQVSLYGWGYAIASGMIMSLTNQDGDYIIITMTDYGTEGISPTGDLITTFGYTLPNPPVILDYSGRGFLLCSRFWVNDNSLYTSGTVNMLIGEELVPITSASTNTDYGDYLVCDVTLRLMSSTLKSYPHGVGALVALTNYTEASPQTLSPVAQYGLYIDNRTVDNNITYGTLDAYATSLLVGLGNFYKKANTWGPLVLAYIPQVGEYYGGLAQPNLSIPPRTSDRVEFTEYTGASAVEYQIVSVTIDCDRMTVTLELGDCEKNVFTSLQQSTNAVNRTLT